MLHWNCIKSPHCISLAFITNFKNSTKKNISYSMHKIPGDLSGKLFFSPFLLGCHHLSHLKDIPYHLHFNHFCPSLWTLEASSGQKLCFISPPPVPSMVPVICQLEPCENATILLSLICKKRKKSSFMNFRVIGSSGKILTNNWTQDNQKPMHSM